jgi:acyl dehydratase
MMQPGAVYASQSLRFAAPVHVGDEAVAEVKALNIKTSSGRHMYCISDTTSFLSFFLSFFLSRPLLFLL